MRVLKKFNTETEYQAWVNGPYMRTPYTCLVTETGNIHYFDGDDNDYSITAVIRKTGWIKLGTPMLMQYIDKVYKNGIEMDLDDEDNPHVAKPWESSYFYRYENKIYDHRFNYHEKDDFKYTPTLVGENLHERGGADDGPWGLNYYPRRFAMGYAHSYYCHGEMQRGALVRFLYVKRDDVVKIVFKGPTIEINNGGVHGRWWQELLFFPDTLKDHTPVLYSLNKVSKEIIFGDGFEGISDKMVHFDKCKKVFFGKNCKQINGSLGSFRKHRVFVRKDTQIENVPEYGKIIKI